MDSVRIVLFNKHKFLVLSEVDDPGNLKLPGGRFEEGETPQEAAERELKEELGTEIELIKAGELQNDDKVSRRYIFSGQVNSVNMKPSAEVEKVEWLSEEEVPEGKNKGHILSAVRLCRGI